MLSGSPPKQALALLPESRRPCLWRATVAPDEADKKKKKDTLAGERGKIAQKAFQGLKMRC